MEGLGVVATIGLVTVTFIYLVSVVIFDRDYAWSLYCLTTDLFPSVHLKIYGSTGTGGLGIFPTFFEENDCRCSQLGCLNRQGSILFNKLFSLSVMLWHHFRILFLFKPNVFSTFIFEGVLIINLELIGWNLKLDHTWWYIRAIIQKSNAVSLLRLICLFQWYKKSTWRRKQKYIIL